MPAHIGRYLAAFFLCSALLGLSLFAGSAGAEVSGFMEWSYGLGRTEAETETDKTETESSSFVQRYNLALDKRFYPNVVLTLAGLFERGDAESRTDGENSSTTFMNIFPRADLSLTTPLYSAGLQYGRRYEIARAGGLKTTNIQESYGAALGYRPDDLPSISAVLSRQHNFDKEREFNDIVTDSAIVGLFYRPVPELALTYQTSYRQSEDRIARAEGTDFTNSGRVSYSTQFLQRRVSVATNYAFSIQESERKSETGGPSNIFSDFIVPNRGLSLLTANLTALSQLLDNSLLIDSGTGASAGIDLGTAPLITPGDFWNIGLDFGGLRDVDFLRVWIDRSLRNTDIPGLFTWSVYVSDDNSTWTQILAPTPAPFDGFNNFFQISFPRQRTRFIKVVVNNLPAGTTDPTGTVNVANVFVTEIQAFTSQTVQAGTTAKSTNTSHTFDFNTRVMLLSRPYVFYDFNYWYARTEPGGFSRYAFANALSASHQFSRVFSGSARVAREDSKDDTNKTVSYLLNASLLATPLPTLSHSLNFSIRQEEVNGASQDSWVVALNNAAELYRGVSVSLSGGVTQAKQATGEKTEGTFLAGGASLVPHRNLTVNISYGETTSKTTGGTGIAQRGESTNNSRSGTITAAYAVRNIYITAGLGYFEQTGQPSNVTQNYSIGWTPLRDGTLQLSVQYLESLASVSNTKERLFSPILRWNINPKTSFTLSYSVSEAESTGQRTTGSALNATLRTVL